MEIRDLLGRLDHVRQCPDNARGDPQWMARCPVHDDQRSSLAISCGRDGKILLKCHAGCETSVIVAALGLVMKDLDAPDELTRQISRPTGKPVREDEYIYKDPNGQPLLKKVKLRYSDGSKSFFWQHFNGGLWINGRAGITPPLYNVAALQDEGQVFIVEGEKDADTMTRLGFTCVSLPDGAAERWNLAYTSAFKGRTVYLIPDNDTPGRAFAETVASGLEGSAEAVYILYLCTVWPDMPEKADISDFVVGHGDAAAVAAVNDLVQRAEPWCSIRPADLSDAGNAESFAKIVKGRLLWCDALGWLVWEGKRWEPSEHRATALAISFAQQMLTDALERYKAALDPETGKPAEDAKRYLAHAQRTRGAIAIKNLLSLSKAYLAIAADKLDAAWWVLNTDAGLVDLRTGEIRPHDPKALCTRLAPFSPSTEGTKLWADFLELITGGDTELQNYLQIKVGCYAFGKIFWEGVDFAVGGGRNGKSTLFNALAAVLGDYAGGIDAQVLTTDRQNRGAALATLRGRRLILCGELEEGQRLSVQTLKRLASTDSLVIEEKYRQPETIKPSHHIVLFSNFLPRVGSTDTGTWRRISVVPFNSSMPAGSDEIPNYADLLVEKAAGAILSWIIEGAVAFHKAGHRVKVPGCVQEATEQYKQSENWIERYLSERCIVEPGARVRGGELYADYRAFAQSTGDYCRRGNDFTKALEGLGYKRQILHGRTTWIGLRVDYSSDFASPPLPKYG